MSFDGLVIRALVHEFKQSLSGGRINKIHQPYETDLVFHIRAGGQNQKLLISANLSFPRVYITNESFINPQEPPMFTMLLRKHLEGGIIHSISQVGMERIIHIDIRSRDELGDDRNLRMVIELMGRHSNIILMDIDRNMILDGIHHITPSISTYRQVLPGRTYLAPPEQGKANPLDIDEAKFISTLSFNEGKLDRQIVDHYSGISPLVAKEILYRAKLPTKENLWAAYDQVIRNVRMHQFEPNIVVTKDGKSYFSVIALTHLEGDAQHFESICECLNHYYQTKADRDLIRQKAQDLLRFLQQEKNRNIKKLEKLEATLIDSEKAEKYKLWGELITSYLFQLKKGDSIAHLPNYYEEDQPVIEISLDPQLSPNENAQAYFKRYNKAKNSVLVVQEQLVKTQEEIAYLDAVIHQVEMADSQNLEEIREELVEQGYLRDRVKHRKAKKSKDTAAKPDQYQSSEGYTILVGRNNKQNDQLTNRIARPNDTWLHTKDIPGSHVVIRGDGYGEKTLHEAAMLAAYYSKGRNSSQVPVDYTLIKHVRKPSGAKPGFVIYDYQKTLFVTPDEAWVSRLSGNVE